MEFHDFDRRLQPKFRVQLRVAAWRPRNDGQSRPALPGTSNLNLFRHGKRIVNLDAKIPDGTLDPGVTKQKLDGCAGYPVDERRLGSSQRVGPNTCESSPMLAIHSETRRAVPRRPVNKNSPGFMPAALRRAPDGPVRSIQSGPAAA